MLTVTIPKREFYDEEKNEFTTVKERKIRLEHSLVSISKWESKHNKPFLSFDNPKHQKTDEETLDYIRTMTITQNVPAEVYKYIPDNELRKITEYIDAPMTATTFAKDDHKKSRQTVTSELIYYWMIALNVPFECQKWHLNRLLTLINVCNVKNQPKKKRSRAEILRRNRAMNEARKKKLQTRG